MTAFLILLGVSLEETLRAYKEKLTTAPKTLMLTHIRCGKWHVCELYMKGIFTQSKNIYSVPDRYQILIYLSPEDTVNSKQTGPSWRFIL